VIRGNIELAQMSSNALDYSDRLQDAIKAADRADALTSQLLALSRKARLEATTVDLPLFWNGFRSIIPRITSASIRVDVDVHPDAATLYCDANQLEVALINLIVNARDAIDGPGKISITCRPATKTDLAMFGLSVDRPYCMIEIRDSGSGIPAGNLSKVVEPFFTTKAVGQGTGLGLPMVKGFCEQSNGSLVIESDPTGTTVRLALPATDSRHIT
ncbi:MAG: ATP-binding protein, partial [Pseudomonadota bacterium]